MRFLFLSVSLASALLLPYLSYVASDDALFYLQISYNGIQNGNVTFNGVDPTNGFHPLQLLSLLAVKSLFGDISKDTFLLTSFVFGFLCSLGALYFLIRYLKEIDAHEATLLLSCSLFATYLFGGMYFSEAAINALLLTIVLYHAQVADREIKLSFSHSLVLGALLGLSVLARLDNVFTVPLIGLLFLFNRQLTAKSTGALALGFLVIFLPYIGFNYLSFGTFTPVSGWAKGTFPEIRDLSVALKDTTLLSKLTFLGLLLTGIGEVILGKRFGVIHCYLLGALISAAYYFLFQHASEHSWYYVKAVLVIAVLLPNQLSRWWWSTRGTKAFAVLLLLLLPLYTHLKGSSHGLFNVNEFIRGRTWHNVVFHDVGVGAKKVLPSDTRVFVFDLPGYIAYFGELSVSPLDCLTLNVKACKELHQDPTAFMKSRRITHALWRFPKGCTGTLPLESYYRKKPIGEISLNCEEMKLISKPFDIYSVPIVF